MTEKITASDARSEFGSILERAVARNDRFLVERDGEPVVLIMSVADFVKTLAPTPNWLKEIQEEAKEKGLDQLSMEEIDAEIDAARRERRTRPGA